MKHLYIVLDAAAAAVTGPLMMFPHDNVAARMFSDIAGDPQTMVNRHPTDHSLIRVGSIDEDTGEITPLFPSLVVISGEQWLASQSGNKA